MYFLTTSANGELLLLGASSLEEIGAGFIGGEIGFGLDLNGGETGRGFLKEGVYFMGEEMGFGFMGGETGGLGAGFLYTGCMKEGRGLVEEDTGLGFLGGGEAGGAEVGTGFLYTGCMKEGRGFPVREAGAGLGFTGGDAGVAEWYPQVSPKCNKQVRPLTASFWHCLPLGYT